eukprot:GHVQ01004237.1.p1 GENE.GHVQ01004237.1~~GHVQ01004237.1.p1  ORF type:complete len:183 (+),score=29.34 GHVQ01004237.1:158-706(+)
MGSCLSSAPLVRRIRPTMTSPEPKSPVAEAGTRSSSPPLPLRLPIPCVRTLVSTPTSSRNTTQDEGIPYHTNTSSGRALSFPSDGNVVPPPYESPTSTWSYSSFVDFNLTPQSLHWMKYAPAFSPAETLYYPPTPAMLQYRTLPSPATWLRRITPTSAASIIDETTGSDGYFTDASSCISSS